jgi:hypothetical protein
METLVAFIIDLIVSVAILYTDPGAVNPSRTRLPTCEDAITQSRREVDLMEG